MPRLLHPTIDGWMPGTNETWAACDGDPVKKSKVAGKGIAGDSIPDLRGVFLRGVDIITSGRAITGRDPDAGATRKVGSYQSDIFLSHAHSASGNLNVMLSDGSGQTAAGMGAANGGGARWDFGVSVSVSSAGGSETRPKNVAVYYYIKVKNSPTLVKITHPQPLS